MTRAVIVVDVQNDFCEGGSLAVNGGIEVARAVSARLARPAGAARPDRPDRLVDGHYDHAVATRDHHIDPGAHFSTHPDYATTWPAHCRVGTLGVELHPELDPSRIEAIFDKGEYQAAYSGFEGASEGRGLEPWLRAHAVEAVEVVGIATDHCVRATALDAAAAGFATTVRLDLTAGVAASTVNSALGELRKAGVTLVGQPIVR